MSHGSQTKIPNKQNLWSGFSARQYRIRVPGWVFMILTLLLGFGAIKSQNNILFFLLGFALTGVVISGLLSGAMLMNLRVIREAIPAVRAGTAARIRYRIQNNSRLIPAFAIIVREVQPSEVKEHDTNTATGRSRVWDRLVNRPTAFAAYVPPRGTLTVTASPNAIARGTAELIGVELSSSFPFGIMLKSIRHRDEAILRVHPEQVDPPQITVPPSPMREHSFHNTQIHRASSGDFFGLREYVAGDSPRLLSWKATARAGEPVTTQLAETPAERLVIELDPLGNPVAPSVRQERAIAKACALMEHHLARGEAVGLAVPRYGLWIEAAHGSRQRHRLLDSLAELDLSQPPVEDHLRDAGTIGSGNVVRIGASDA